ncbi:MAG TPA: hypothetical protein GX515_07935 [Firmicutes bacterium]|nr:hypothetical protein [Bacillota bacterium]
MRERMRKRHPQFAPSVRIQTFHGLCATALCTEARHTGLPRDFVIYDEAADVFTPPRAPTGRATRVSGESATMCRRMEGLSCHCVFTRSPKRTIAS